MKAKLEEIKNKIFYFFRNIRSNIRTFYIGVKNIWKWKKIIYNDRWWDYHFLHEILKFKLEDMEKNWSDSHYVNFEEDQKEIHDLVELLKTIDEKDDMTEDISAIYEEFGHKLFSKRKFMDSDRSEYETSLILKLWD